MAHSKKYAKVKYYYEQGYWKKFMVYNIVGWIYNLSATAPRQPN